MLLCLAVLAVFCVFVTNGESSCTKARVFEKQSQSYRDVTTECVHGCCGVQPNQTCCTVSVAVAVGSLAGAIAALCLLLVLVYCCLRKWKSSQRAVQPDPAPGMQHYLYRPRTPHHTNISVVYAGYPGCAWTQAGGGRRARPIKPPPYLDRDTPPPPYSPTHPQARYPFRQQTPSLPGTSRSPEIETFPPGTVPPASDDDGDSGSDDVESDASEGEDPRRGTLNDDDDASSGTSSISCRRADARHQLETGGHDEEPRPDPQHIHPEPCPPGATGL